MKKQVSRYATQQNKKIPNICHKPKVFFFMQPIPERSAEFKKKNLMEKIDFKAEKKRSKAHSLCKQCLHDLHLRKRDPSHQTFPS